MYKIIISFAFLFLLFTGCNITQEYTFNKDFSGKSDLEIDLSAFISFMGSMDSLNQNNTLDSLSYTFEKVAAEYENLGAKNISYGWKNNQTMLYLTYEFSDIDLLNKVLAAETGELLGGNFMGNKPEKVKFIKEGKNKITYNAPKVTNDTLLKNDDLAAMKEYYNYTLKFNFASPIKKIDNKNAELSSDKKSLKYSGSLFDIFASGYSTDFKIKLKH